MYKSIKVRESFVIYGTVYTIKYTDITRDKYNQYGTCTTHRRGYIDLNDCWREGDVETTEYNIYTLEKMCARMRSYVEYERKLKKMRKEA